MSRKRKLSCDWDRTFPPAKLSVHGLSCTKSPHPSPTVAHVGACNVQRHFVGRHALSFISRKELACAPTVAVLRAGLSFRMR